MGARVGRGWGGAAAQSRTQQRGARGADGVKKGVPGGGPCTSGLPGRPGCERDGGAGLSVCSDDGGLLLRTEGGGRCRQEAGAWGVSQPP